MPKEDQTKIRIVDLNGNARKVTTRYPELNVQALNSQGRAYEKTSQGAFENSVKVSSSPTYVKKDSVAPAPKVDQTFDNAAAQPQNFVENQASEVAPIVVGGTVGAVQANSDKTSEVVEYDLNATTEAQDTVAAPTKTPEKKSLKKEKAKKSAVKEKPAAKAASTKGKFFVQVGSFSNQENASSTLNKMEKFHAGTIETVAGEKTIYRVWLGPFNNRVSAENMVKKVAASGHEAILVKGK